MSEDESIQAEPQTRKKGKKLAPGLALVRDLDGTMARVAAFLADQPGRAVQVDVILRLVGSDPTGDPAAPCPNCGGVVTPPSTRS